MSEQLSVALAQIAPVWLNKTQTLDKIMQAIQEAATKGAKLVTFGESLLPGYPFWLELTGGAAFNDPKQKRMFAHYLDQAVNVASGDLQPLCEQAKQLGVDIVLGTAERAADRGGHSIYCGLVYISAGDGIRHVHRKLMPTYEERLTWSVGDGYGLKVQPINDFRIAALNCWENWMPLARAAMYAQGSNVHVAIWPGGLHNTHDITPFIAKESRGYAVSTSSLMRKEDFPSDTPLLEEILDGAKGVLANGGSCVAAPDGSWLLEPQVGNEGVFVVEMDHARIREERQNFDPVGHYSRPDVLQLQVNRLRQSTAIFTDD